MPAKSAKPKLISDAAVKAATGKTWPQWFSLLDKAGAKKMNHREIVAVLNKKYKVGSWWQQMVTVSYEQSRGLRQLHQKPDGFEISRGKTIAAPMAKLFDAWQDAALRRRWLGEDIHIRKATPGKYLRITWADGESNVNVDFIGKGPRKTQISVQHGKLPDAKAAAAQKSYWEEKLDSLRALLEK
jgi:uncharacterized protein YndB with AHSA1/START domain